MQKATEMEPQEKSPKLAAMQHLKIYNKADILSLTKIRRFETKLGGYHHLPAEGGESFVYKFFVCVRAVNFSGIEERNAAFDCRPNQRDHLLLVVSRAVSKAHSHAAQPDSRDFQIALSKFALFHV